MKKLTLLSSRRRQKLVEGNNKFEEHIKNIMVEAKFKSDVEVKISDFRLNWMQECGRANWGIEAINNICA